MKTHTRRSTLVSLLLVCLLLLLAACQPISPASVASSASSMARSAEEQANQAVVQRFYDEVFTQKKMEVLGELFDPNLVIHDLDVGGEAGGPTLLQDTLTAFPDVKATVNLWVAQDDLVTAAVSYTGTHQAEFLGVAPTGKTVTWNIIDVWRVQNGKIVELWHDVPNNDILEQIQPQASGTMTNTIAAANSEVTFSIDESGMHGPKEIPSGRVQVTLQNSGQAFHSLFVSRLLENATLAAALTELPGASDKNSVLIGAGFMAPGARYHAVLDLAPGNYYLTDVVADTLAGYEFVVTETATASPGNPAPTVSVTEQEYTYAMPDEISAGAQWWQIENQGKLPHDLTLYRLDNGLTQETLLEQITTAQAEQKPEPASVLQWVTGPGQTNWVQFDLAAGDYVALSLTPDLSTMPPGERDFHKGMVQAFTVK